MMRRYFSRAISPRTMLRRRHQMPRGDDKDGGFLEVKNCFMIFGGRLAQLTTRQRKRKRREVYAAETPYDVTHVLTYVQTDQE
jgi:hypothetical protein